MTSAEQDIQTDVAVQTGAYQRNAAIVPVDVGSTDARRALLLHLPNGPFGSQLVEIEQDVLDWSNATEVVEVPGVSPFKCVRGEKLGELLGFVEGVKGYIEQVKELGISLSAIGTSGFGHSLVVENAVGNRVMLLDGPSLASYDFTDQQREVLTRYGLPVDPNFHIKSTMKLLTLRNHPEVVQTLFGGDTTFNDLHFSTMQGLVARVLSTTGKDDGIPLDDLRYFGTNELAQDPENVITMLRELGFYADQILVNRSSSDFSPRMRIDVQQQDWPVAGRLIKLLRETGLVDLRSVVIEFDTVGKMISPDLPFKKPAVTGEHYTTQRVVGAINSVWLGRMFFYKTHDGKTKIDFDRIGKIVEEISHMPSDLNTFYFDPDDMAQRSEIGTLRQFEGGKSKILHPKDLLQLSGDDQKKVTLAIITGMIFGLRDKIEHVMVPGQKYPPIEMYGGIITYGGQPWMRIIRQVFSQSEVYALKNMGGLIATASAVAEKLHIDIKDLSIKRDFVPLQELSREEDYAMWKRMRSIYSQ